MVVTGNRFIIRTDASAKIGTGHVMRCLVFANLIREQGGNVSFVCRELPGDMNDYIEEQGFRVFRLSAEDGVNTDGVWPAAEQIADADKTESVIQYMDKVDWLVVDHYNLDSIWEVRLGQRVPHILVIDDLANRTHTCNILLDQNLYDAMQSRYQGLVPEECRLLLGPEYVLLREEFFEVRKRLGRRVINAALQRVFVFFGGSDPTGETVKLLDAIAKPGFDDINYDVVVGNSNVNKDSIKLTCKKLDKVHYYCQIANIAELMARADLAIGAAGSASWERCFLGLPSIVVITADNQREVAVKLSREQVVISLGESADVQVGDYLQAIKKFRESPEQLKAMSNNCYRLMPENRIKSELMSIV